MLLRARRTAVGRSDLWPTRWPGSGRSCLLGQLAACPPGALFAVAAVTVTALWLGGSGALVAPAIVATRGVL